MSTPSTQSHVNPDLPPTIGQAGTTQGVGVNLSPIVLVREKGQNGCDLMKRSIKKFWAKFGGKKTKGHGFSKREKLAALIEWSRIVIPYYKQRPLPERRAEFNDGKAKLHPMKRFGKCFACAHDATCRHHVIQLQNGGINSRKNVVSLCAPCHADIHPWLR